MTKILLILLLSISTLWAGTNTVVIYPNGDIVNYAPPDGSGNVIHIAPDSARYEPRWHPMLDDTDYKNLTYIIAGQQGNNGNTFIFGH